MGYNDTQIYLQKEKQFVSYGDFIVEEIARAVENFRENQILKI